MGKPNVGMMYPIWAPFTSQVDGSMPTYGTGRKLKEARKATITFERGNNPLYGDDRIVDDDQSITGVTVSFETTGLTLEDRQSVFGEDTNTGTAAGQWISDNDPPWGGLGFIRVMRDEGTRKFQAMIIMKIKLHEDSQETNTREGQINWGTPTITGRAAGIYVDSTDKARFVLEKEFTTISDAKSFLNSQLNYSAPVVTT